jgi:hypothetical protein
MVDSQLKFNAKAADVTTLSVTSVYQSIFVFYGNLFLFMNQYRTMFYPLCMCYDQ